MSLSIELGCGNKPTPGYLHHDRWKHSPHVDLGFELDVFPWPLQDRSVGRLLATDVFEHLKVDVHVWLAECWRVMEPNGVLSMRLPSYDHPHGYSYRDITHQRVFHRESFWYFCPNAPGTLWKDFGRYYFGPEYHQWWEFVSVERECGDWRFTLRKVGA